MSPACGAPAAAWPLWAGIAGLGAAWWLAPRMEELARGAGWVRRNWRGDPVATGLGVILPAAGAAGSALANLAAGTWPAAAAGLALVAAAALFGLVDDLADRHGRHGWAAHVGGLVRGGWTGGAAKLVGITLASLAAGAFCPAGTGLGRWSLAVLGGLVVAGTANLVNLADTRPGRALKVWYLAAILLGLAGAPAASAWLFPWAAAGLPLLARDLSESAMMGDAGSNALGAALGMGLVLAAPGPVLAAAAVALLVLQGLGDRWSFHGWIEGRSWLRALDGLGRWRPPTAGNLPRVRE